MGPLRQRRADSAWHQDLRLVTAMRDLRNLPDPRPDLPIYARLDMQHGSYIAYEVEDGFIVLAGNGDDIFDGEVVGLGDVATLMCESGADA